MDDEKPSTKHLVLKAKDIVPMDRVARAGDGSAISVQLIHRQNLLAEERANRRKAANLPVADPVPMIAAPLSPIFKPKEITRTDPPFFPDDDEAITVPDILLENRVAEEDSGWGRVKPRRRKFSRRTRDFVLMVGLADLAVVITMRQLADSVSFIYGISAITLLSSTVAWIMFVVMDDY
jgi:hypothetical protein